MFRIGLLGCGFLATFYMQGLAEVPNQQVTIVYGRDKRKAADFAARWNIPRSSDAMLAVAADKDVDLLVIALPNNLHLEAALLAAQHKNNVTFTTPLPLNTPQPPNMLSPIH